MTAKPPLTKIIFIIGIAVIIALNLYTFIIAYPETYAINAGINFRLHTGKRFLSLLHGRLETLE